MANRAVELSRRLGLVDNELRGADRGGPKPGGRKAISTARTQTLSGVIDRLEAYRAELAPIDFLKQGFGDRFSDAYGVGVRVQMRRGRVADALTAAERLRSRAFADLLARHRVREADDAEAESGAWRWAAARRGPPSSGAPADSPRMLAAMDSVAHGALAVTADHDHRRLLDSRAGSYAWVVQPDGAIHAVDAARDAGRSAARRASGVRRCPGCLDQRSVLARSRRWPSTAPARLSGAARACCGRRSSSGCRATRRAHHRSSRTDRSSRCRLARCSIGRGRYVIERYSLHYAASGAVLADAAEETRTESAPDARRLLVADPQPLPGWPMVSGCRD